MKTCNKCFHRFQDARFRTQQVTRTTEDTDGGWATESYRVSRGSVCNNCEARRQRFRRRTQTVHDCAIVIKALIYREYESYPKKEQRKERQERAEKNRIDRLTKALV